MSAYARPVFIRAGVAHQPPQVAFESTLLPSGGPALFPESWLQKLLFDHPDALPVREILPSMQGLVPICMELETGAGPADVLYLTPAGQIVLAETKLWRNAEARRIVVAQVLDYAKQLTRWRYEDLDAAVARATGKGAGWILKAMRERFPQLDEAPFIDGINRHLETGDLLLLIAGDGIRSSTEALVGFMERYGSLRFSFGLIEVGVFEVDGGLFVQPRILAKTEVIRRTVFIPQSLAIGQSLGDAEQGASAGPQGKEPSPEAQALGDWHEAFWSEYLKRLQLDDASQPLPPKARRDTNLYLPMPPTGQSCWLSAYLARGSGNAGVYLTWPPNYAGAKDVFEALKAAQDDIEKEVGLPLLWTTTKDGKFAIEARRALGDLNDPVQRDAVLGFLTTYTNRMVNALRPRIEAFLAEQKTVN
jgi:hypothetical protein